MSLLTYRAINLTNNITSNLNNNLSSNVSFKNRINKSTKRLSTKLLCGLVSVIGFSAFATDLKVGDDAPNFNLQSTTGDYYQLSDYKGKQAVVIAWYPMANTRGCTIECKSLTEQGHLIREYDVSYFMASVDELDENRDFAQKTGADFPMLSDPTKETAKAYQVLNMFKVADRTTFYIGKHGKIIKIDESISPSTAAQDMANNLEKLGVAKK